MPEGNETLEQGTRAFLAILPQAVELRLAVESAAPGAVSLSMPWDAALVGDPVSGVIHGGAVFTLMDTCAGAAVLTHPQAGAPTATLDMRIDYLRPATPGQRLFARAECHTVTRTVAFVRAEAHDGDPARPFAVVAGAFTVGKGS